MMRAALVGIALATVPGSPAAAHKLKVFATVQGEAITGYAFFIGGGRAKGTPWIANDGAGAELARGETDGDGAFRIVPPAPVRSDVTITVDTQEGHVATAVVPATRFGPPGAPPAAPASSLPAAAPDRPADDPAPVGTETAAFVEAAVQRQVTPVLERLEQMDERLRFTDVLSGMFLIVGLAGMALWARSRRG